MSESEGVVTPVTPVVSSVSELRRVYADRAKHNNAPHHGQRRVPFASSIKTLGSEWGVGVGLHFELMKWLRWLFLFMMVCAVPFMVVIGCSVFTDAQHMNDRQYGIKIYPTTEIHSMTFAAIIDDSIDNGTLQYLNTKIGGVWNGPMQKSTFLVWISLVDTGSTLVFILCLALLWYHLKRFAVSIDTATLEASDFTVLVRGLPPDTDAVEVGEYFRQYGELMDVVLVTDRLSSTLVRCGKAARLHQRRNMVLDASTVCISDEIIDMMAKLDGKLSGITEEIKGVAQRQQHVRAAFVTFNSENERRACVNQCPNSWFETLWQPKTARFRQHCRVWVLNASAPEDYNFEHLAVSEWSLAGREFAINLAMLVLVLVCAAAITKLTDISNQESSIINWHEDRLIKDAASAMTLFGNSTQIAAGANFSDASNSSTPSTAAARDVTLRTQLPPFCTAQLRDACSSQLRAEYSGVVHMEWGQALMWANATSQLLYGRAVREALKCSVGSTNLSRNCGLVGCLACSCLGVSDLIPGAVGAVDGASADSQEVQQMCEPYINQLDIRSWGIRLAISAVVAVLNSAIKWIMRVLVKQGRHWTHTARERSYALQCFIATLINTVVVLLLTNCDSLGRIAREKEQGSWVRYFVRYGSYSDFTAGWYENVGLSIFILMLINAFMPPVDVLWDRMWQWSHRCCVLHVVPWPLQSDFDAAWARPRFTLGQRTADLLLNVSLALLFGTGMPLLYLVLAVYLGMAELADRLAITRLCSGAPRYHDALCKLVLVLLPWLAVSHCAFGLWMHTYFHVVVPKDGANDNVTALGAAAARATNVPLSALQQSGLWQRITQPNGLPLLLLLLGLALWLLIGRYLVWKTVSCLSRATGRLLCGHARRLIRMQLTRDTNLEVHTLPYAEALVDRKLYGTPTYRLAHHPHYHQYFAASSSNTAEGVSALLMAAASGGGQRLTYTRLKTIPRRGRHSISFRVLNETCTDPGGFNFSSIDLALGRPSVTAALNRASVTNSLLGRASVTHTNGTHDLTAPPSVMELTALDTPEGNKRRPNDTKTRLTPKAAKRHKSSSPTSDSARSHEDTGRHTPADVHELLQREAEQSAAEASAVEPHGPMRPMIGDGAVEVVVVARSPIRQGGANAGVSRTEPGGSAAVSTTAGAGALARSSATPTSSRTDYYNRLCIEISKHEDPEPQQGQELSWQPPPRRQLSDVGDESRSKSGGGVLIRFARREVREEGPSGGAAAAVAQRQGQEAIMEATPAAAGQESVGGGGGGPIAEPSLVVLLTQEDGAEAAVSQPAVGRTNSLGRTGHGGYFRGRSSPGDRGSTSPGYV